MIVVQVGHAQVITFLLLSCELSILSLSLMALWHFLGKTEKTCADENCIYFC
jgi:hypothetical protein